MRLLICTQAIDRNDPALGFFVSWVREFAAHFEKITVEPLASETCFRLGERGLQKAQIAHAMGSPVKLNLIFVNLDDFGKR